MKQNVYAKLATEESLLKTVEALKEHNFEPLIVQGRVDALEEIKKMIPQGASLMNGSSRTLEEIGFIEYLKRGEHGWNNLHEMILKEGDKQKQSKLRQESLNSQYYLGSVHAVSETGELVIASASGSQLPHIVYTSPNIIFVVGTHKITQTLDEAIKRVREYVSPLEDERMKSTGAAGTVFSKMLVYEREPEWSGRKIRLILVKEKLGF